MVGGFDDPSGCDAFPLDVAKCGADVPNGVVDWAGAKEAGVDAVLSITPKVQPDERLRLKFLGTDGKLGTVIDISYRTFQGVKLETAIAAVYDTPEQVLLGTRGSLAACSHPTQLVITGGALTFDNKVERFLMNGQHNTASLSFEAATPIAPEWAGAGVCSQVCGNIRSFSGCEEAKRFYEIVLPPLHTAWLSMGWLSDHKNGSNWDVTALRDDADTICSLGFDSAYDTWKLRKARLQNLTATERTVVLQVSRTFGHAVNYNLAVKIGPSK